MGLSIFETFNKFGDRIIQDIGLPIVVSPSTQTQIGVPDSLIPRWSDINDDGNLPEDGANKREIFAQNSAPVSNYKEGDLWFDTDDSNTLYRANAALTWVSVKDGTIGGKVSTFYQAGIPTSLAAGDLWFDTDDGNKPYRAAAAGATTIAPGAWVAVQDGTISTAQTTADGKIKVFAQTSIPISVSVGDLWIDTDDENKLYRATIVGADQITAGEWVLYRDASIAAAQAAADNAQTAADNAQTDATTANNAIADIASDSILSQVEKPSIVQNNTVILAEQAGIDAQATAYGITTEKTAYDAAVTALTAYLATLTTPVLWSNLTGDTTIVGATFRSKFSDVYTTRQALLDAIAAAAGTKATWAGVSGANKPADNATVNATFAQDAVPTSLAIGDLWMDTNDSNKIYRAASVGADQITAGEWILVVDTVVDDNTSPANPSGLTASAGIQAVFLKWTWNTETDMDHYDIYRFTTDTQGSAVKIASVKVNMMFDSGLTAAQAYYYWIKAVDRRGNASGFNASAGTTATPRNVGETDVSDDAITAGKINVATLAAIVADLGAITAGTITMDTAGYIRGGQTAYNTGTGFFLGYSTSAYKFSIGVPTGDYLTWDGTNLTVSASRIVKLFTAGMALTAGEVVFMHTDGKVYSGDAGYTGQTSKAFGICLTTTAENASAPIQTFGTASGLSSLTIASTYYLQNATQTLDQSSTNEAGGGQSIATTEVNYQSFTTGLAQNLSKIILKLSTGNESFNFTLKIRTGEGVAGTLLATKAMSFNAGVSPSEATFVLDVPIALGNATQYSITLLANSTTPSWMISDTSNPYANGRNDVAANKDYYFKTYYSTARGALGTSAGTVSKIIGFATSATELQLNYVIT